MAQDKLQSDPSQDALKRGYEVDYLRLRWLAISLAALIVVAIAIHVGLWYFMKSLTNQTRSADIPRSVVTVDPQVPSPAPPLQPTEAHDRTPPQDLNLMLQREDAVFEHLGWKVDRATHRATPPHQLVQVVAQRQSVRTPATRPGGAP